VSDSVLIYLYNVALEIFSILQISSIVLFLLSYNDCAMAIFFGVLRVVALGLPPNRPRALAAWSPALVRSRIRARSNSAKEAKILKSDCCMIHLFLRPS